MDIWVVGQLEPLKLTPLSPLVFCDNSYWSDYTRFFNKEALCLVAKGTPEQESQHCQNIAPTNLAVSSAWGHSITEKHSHDDQNCHAARKPARDRDKRMNPENTETRSHIRAYENHYPGQGLRHS
jgi:hypothetical protein